jgi:hypothetical protein
MTLLEIILLGYIVNIGSTILMGILIVSSTIIAGPEGEKNIVILNLLIEKEKLLKSSLKLKNKSILLQENFIFWIPFSGLLSLVEFLAGSLHNGPSGFLIEKIMERIQKLEDRLNTK